MDDSFLISHLCSRGYSIKGSVHIPKNGVPEKNFLYVDGHHSELMAYGHIRLMNGMWGNPETEITILPPEVFVG